MSKSFSNSNEALNRLVSGNSRFVQGLRSIESMSSVHRLAELAEKGQKPFCMVLTCADSRIPVETLFDQGAGDIFVVRVAGNIVAPSLVGSLEFAALKFGVPLCVVMGHTKCGAIDAAIQNHLYPQNNGAGKSKPHGHIHTIVDEIDPTVRELLKTHNHHDYSSAKFAELVTLANVEHTAKKIQTMSPILNELVGAGQLAIREAVCDIATGRVTFGPFQIQEESEFVAQGRVS